jgi:membrane protease subunit HflK
MHECREERCRAGPEPGLLVQRSLIPQQSVEKGVSMPWSNQGGGGGGWKGGGGGGPWGQGPSGGGGGGQQPDLEEILRRSQDRLKQVMPGAGLPGPVLFLLAAIGIAVAGFYAFTFRVQPDELGVVLRFGEFVRQEPPGLHFRLPYPVEEVRLPKVTRKNTIEVGFRSSVVRRGSTGATNVPEESGMLTGDENVVEVPFVVIWRIQDAEKYLFRIQNPDTTVKDVAESAMREVVGKSDFERVLTSDLGAIRTSVQKLMQDTLNSYDAGIIIDEVSLQRVFPPSTVGDAFRDVQAARIDLETAKNQAQAYASKIVPEARGAADRIIAEAEAYKKQTVEEAIGQASRFSQVLDEYKKAPDVTRQRLYLETMERVLGGADKIILDSKAASGVVPYLPLDQLQRSKPPGAK